MTTKKYTIEQFMDNELIVRCCISSDGKKIIYSSDNSGVFNAYLLSEDNEGPIQITDSKESAIHVVTSLPNDKGFLYSSDQEGNEINHLYLCDEEGNATELTTGEKERAQFEQWCQDDSSFLYASSKRDSQYMDLYKMNLETLTAKMIYQNTEGLEIGSISKDERYISLVKTITANNNQLYLYDLDKEELKPILEHEGEINYIPREFSLDSRYLYYLTDKDSEFNYLKKYNIEKGETETYIQENWGITFTRFSKNHRYLVYGVNCDGATNIKIFNMVEEKYLPLPDFPAGQVRSLSISDNEKYLAFILDSSTSPTNLYKYNLSTCELEKLTDTLSDQIREEDLVEAEVIRFKSFDGLEIPSIYYKPKVKPGQQVPALVWVHGGPGGQSRIMYSALIQYLVNHGYAILAVNNRGSSGYGKTFFKAADLKHGEIDLADIVESKKFLKSTGDISPDQIGIMGGSYGGFMVLAALAFQPEEFAVGVDIFGVSNWERTLKSIPEWWETMRDALYKKMGDPYKDTEYIRSISPLFHAGQITKPLMVLQGANDPRVLKEESDEIVEAVKENDVPVEYIVFKDEGHGFVKKENQIEGYKGILEFVDRYLNK